MIQTNPHFSAPSAIVLPQIAPDLLWLGALMLLGGLLLLRRWQRPRRRMPVGAIRHTFKPHAAPDRVASAPNPAPPAPADLRDPQVQLAAVTAVCFQTVPLLNRDEYRLLPVLEKAALALNAGHRVMAQTSLAEILRPREGGGTSAERKAALSSINAKRLDFAIFDRAGHLKIAVQYQGFVPPSDSRTFLFDAVKREVLRKAGVPLLDIVPDFQPDEVTAQIMAILKPAQV